MAKVTITFEDSENGVEVKVVSDPPFNEDNSYESQHLGAKVIEYLNELYEQHDDDHSHCCGNGGCENEKCGNDNGGCGVGNPPCDT